MMVRALLLTIVLVGPCFAQTSSRLQRKDKSQEDKNGGLKLKLGANGLYEHRRINIDFKHGDEFEKFKQALVGLPVIVPVNKSDQRLVLQDLVGAQVDAKLSFGEWLSLNGAAMYSTGNNGDSVAVVGRIEAVFPAEKDFHTYESVKGHRDTGRRGIVSLRLRSSISEDSWSYRNAQYTNLAKERTTLGYKRKDLLLHFEGGIGGYNDPASLGPKGLLDLIPGYQVTTLNTKVGIAQMCRSYSTGLDDNLPGVSSVFGGGSGPVGNPLFNEQTCGYVAVIDPSLVVSQLWKKGRIQLRIGREFLFMAESPGFGSKFMTYADLNSEFNINKWLRANLGVEYRKGVYSQNNDRINRTINHEALRIKLLLFPRLAKPRKDRLGMKRR